MIIKTIKKSISEILNKYKPHKCKPMEYPETGEVMIFHWDIPWTFSQTFTVCQECNKVKVISDTTNDNRSILGGYKKEIDGEVWSGKCDYAKVPSIGVDRLIFQTSKKLFT